MSNVSPVPLGLPVRSMLLRLGPACVLSLALAGCGQDPAPVETPDRPMPAEPAATSAAPPPPTCPLLSAGTIERLAREAGVQDLGSVRTEFIDESDYVMLSGSHAERFTRLRLSVPPPGSLFFDVIEGGEKSDGSRYSVVSVTCSTDMLSGTPCPALAELQAHPRAQGTVRTIASVFPLSPEESEACRGELSASGLAR